MGQKPLPVPRTYHLQLADALEQMAKDLRYKPGEGECVEVEPQRLRELMLASANIALYQGIFDNMTAITSMGPVAVKTAIKDLRGYAKRIGELL
jgi:hypothetical protein